MRRACSLLLVLALLAALPQAAQAQRLGLSNLVVDNQAGRAKVRFGVAVEALDAVRQALENGQVLALSCKAILSQSRDYLWNSELASADMLSTLYLHENGPYEISLPGGRREHYRSRDLDLVMKEAWGGLSMDLGPWDRLERGHSYSLDLEIRLLRQDVPGWLKGTLFFWNFDAVSPVKYRLDFSY